MTNMTNFLDAVALATTRGRIELALQLASFPHEPRDRGFGTDELGDGDPR
jgi:hypothetical protein